MAMEGASVDGELWRRKEVIGRGGFGTVYLASSKPKRGVGPRPALMAVKSAELSVSGSLQMEREILRNFACCPHIIHCFREEITTGEKGEKVYNLVLEYASGGSLRDLIKKSGGVGLPELDVRCYTRSILRGIKLVHDRGFAHLDIKPENILLMRQRHSISTTTTTQFMAKICNFGLAKEVSSEQSNKKKRSRKLNPYFRGTPMYLSPEAIVEGEQGTPSDIWGIGCVVLEMLTGKPVWDRKRDWKTKEFLRKMGYEFKIPKIPNEISDEAKEFLNSCFVRNVRARLSADKLLKLPFVKSIGDEEEEEEREGGEDEEEEEEEEEDCNIESNDALNIGSCSDDFYFRSLLEISKSLNVKEEVRSIEPNNITSIDSEEQGEPIEDYEEEEEQPIEDYEEEEEEEEPIEEEEEPVEDHEEEEEEEEEEKPIEEEEEPVEDYEKEEEEEQQPIEDYDCIHSFFRVMLTATKDQNADAKDLEIPDHKRRRIDD